ncbi:MAG: shikimate dehydrogenase [Armatimonadota bacterium]
MSVFAWRDAPAADYAVIGFPVRHSLSPMMHMAAYKSLSIDASYVAVELSPAELEAGLEHLVHLGYKGVNVTIPHKESAFRWAATTCTTSEKLQVSNTIRFSDRTAVNTDVPGFLSSLPGHAQTALLLGAGGSARAVAYALARQGTEVSIWNRTQSRAEELVEQIGIDCRVVSTLEVKGYGLIVNTTSTGLSGESLPIDWSGAEPDTQLAYDLAYSDSLTPFLAEAKAYGIAGMDGRRMLMEQGAYAFEYWFDRPAPREAMWEAIQ